MEEHHSERVRGSDNVLLVVQFVVLFVEIALVVAEVVQRGWTALLRPQTFVIAAAFILLVFFLISLIIQFLPEHKTSSQARTFSRNMLLFSAVVVLVFLGGYVGFTVNSAQRQTYFSRYSSALFDFETLSVSAGVEPWYFITDTGTGIDLQLSDDYSNTGKGSLRARVAHLSTQDSQYTDVAFDQELSGITSITAWVFVPRTEQTIGVDFSGYLYIQTWEDPEISTAVFGDAYQITPGEWTPLYLGYVSQIIKGNETLYWSGTATRVIMRLWTSDPYQGSFYIDDVVVFR